MNKIEIIKQAIELRTGRKCIISEQYMVYQFILVRQDDDWYDTMELSKELVEFLPLSETEVTEKNGWVSVKERLPAERKKVLIYLDIEDAEESSRDIQFGMLNGSKEWMILNILSGKFEFAEEEITHWMPLPAPPINK